MVLCWIVKIGSCVFPWLRTERRGGGGGEGGRRKIVLPSYALPAAHQRKNISTVKLCLNDLMQCGHAGPDKEMLQAEQAC